MAWFSKLFIFIVLSVLLIHCQSPANKNLDKFKKVNESISKTNGRLTDTHSLEYLYSSIHQNRQKNEMLTEKAGKLYSVAKDAQDYLEQLKEKMAANDSAGTNTAVAAKLLVGTPVADTLSQKLLAVYDQSHAAVVDGNKMASIELSMSICREIRANKQWTAKYFDGTFTIGAITILNKFQYDCHDAARIALTDIKQHLEN